MLNLQNSATLHEPPMDLAQLQEIFPAFKKRDHKQIKMQTFPPKSSWGGCFAGGGLVGEQGF